MGSLAEPTLSLLFLLTGSLGQLVCVECVSVFGSMTWVEDCGSTIPWSALTSTWYRTSVAPETEGVTCTGAETPA